MRCPRAVLCVVRIYVSIPSDTGCKWNTLHLMDMLDPASQFLTYHSYFINAFSKALCFWRSEIAVLQASPSVQHNLLQVNLG